MNHYRTISLCAILLLGGCSTPKQPAKSQESAPKPLFKIDPATAASVSGKINFTGKRPPRKKINIEEDEECVRLNKAGLYDDAVVVNKGGTLANVFVYVKKGLEGKTFERPQSAVVLEQKGCRFTPRVFAVRAGQTFYVTNSDPVTHNVHPVAKMNREWNQSQTPGDPPIERRFVRPEIMVRIKCNVHSWMRSWVAVIEHPYFAVSGSDGSFTIPNLPPGDYTVEAWHETLGVREQPLHLDAGAKAALVFNFNGE